MHTKCIQNTYSIQAEYTQNTHRIHAEYMQDIRRIHAEYNMQLYMRHNEQNYVVFCICFKWQDYCCVLSNSILVSRSYFQFT